MIREWYSYHCRYKAVDKYFRRRSAMRGWIFSDLNVKSNGIKEVVAITKMMDVRIQRHVLIRGNANPFDAAYCDYFQKRKQWKKSQSGIQRRADRRIYAKMQSSLLPDASL
jgi:RNA-directed DNA polymerase